MQNLALLHVLLDHLEAVDTSPADIQHFVDRWGRLRHGYLPCPVCYIKGEEQPLTPLSAEGNVEPVVCRSCGTRFKFRLKNEVSMSSKLDGPKRADLLCFPVVAQPIGHYRSPIARGMLDVCAEHLLQHQ